MINLCGQPFTKVKADIIEPKVYVYNDVGEFDINSIYVLSAATIVDVLDPNITAFMRVKDPTGEFVTSEYIKFIMKQLIQMIIKQHIHSSLMLLIKKYLLFQ